MPPTSSPENAPDATRARKRFSYGSAAPAVAAPAGAFPATLPPAIAVESPYPRDEWNKVWISLALFLGCFGFLYSYEIQQLVVRWQSDPGWSHGFIVPGLSAIFIKFQWDALKRAKLKGSIIGLVIMMLGVLGQVLFRATGNLHMSELSMLVVLFGMVLFVFGWDHMKVLWLPIAFLGFAIPPPSTIYVAMTTPMQRIAAELGVRLLPLFGGTGIREGTTILVKQGSQWTTLFVAQACSGMRMLVAFFALAVALAYRSSRPMWQKVFLAACALPIAIICNAMRVTLTGVLAAQGGSQWAEGNTHEMVGLFMLIPALFMQLGVAWVLDRIFVEDSEEDRSVKSDRGVA